MERWDIPHLFCLGVAVWWFFNPAVPVFTTISLAQMIPQSHSLSEYLRLLLRQSGTSLESQSSPWKGGISHSSFVRAWLLGDFSILQSVFTTVSYHTDDPIVHPNILDYCWDKAVPPSHHSLARGKVGYPTALLLGHGCLVIFQSCSSCFYQWPQYLGTGDSTVCPNTVSQIIVENETKPYLCSITV